MSTREASRGQPLLVLAVILGAWLVGRALLWGPPFPLREALPAAIAHNDMGDAVAAFGVTSPEEGPAPRGSQEEWRAPATLHSPILDPSAALLAIAAPPPVEWRSDGTARRRDAPIARRAAGHQMLLAAAFASRNLPPELGRADEGKKGHAAYIPPAPRVAVADRPLLGTAPVSRAARERRFSGDAWALWREGSAAPAAPGISAYGRSQAGAVLRYRLLPGHSFLPTAYARVTRTLEGPRQSELAAGLSLRPLPAVPVSVAAEARVSETAAGREVRPAAFAVTQLPPVSLPMDLRGEAYVQAGYVGGRFETAFVDGQARIDRRLMRLGDDEEVRAGVGAWGGAQKGAARLDVGPTASVAFRLGDAPSRIAVDYRLRVAGDAAPASGPAVTFSAGF